VRTQYYTVGGGGAGRGGAPATSGGLQLDVSVGRLNLVMSESAEAAAGEQMSNCALYYTAWLRAQIFRLRFQIFCKTREYIGCAGACTELHQVSSLNVMEWILILWRMAFSYIVLTLSVPILQKTNRNSPVRILGYRLVGMFDSRHPTPLVPKFFPQGKASEAVNRITHLHLTSVSLDVQCLINSPVLDHCFPKAVRPLTLYYKISISNITIIIINIKDWTL